MNTYEFDYENYGGIETPIDNLEPSVWDRGYYCETDEGTWYELYFAEEQKKYYPTLEPLQQTFNDNLIDGAGFKGLLLFHFEVSDCANHRVYLLNQNSQSGFPELRSVDTVLYFEDRLEFLFSS